MGPGTVVTMPAPETYLLALAAVLAGLVGLIFLGPALRQQEKGLYLFLLLCVALPVELTDQLHLVHLLAAGLIGLWLFRQLVLSRRLQVEFSRTTIALLVFMSVCVLAFLAGQFPWYPIAGAPLRAQIGGLGIFLLSGSIFLLFGHILREPKQLERLVWFFLSLSAIVAALVSLPGVSDWTAAAIEPHSIGSLFWTWVVALSLSQALFNRQLTAWKRALCFVLALAPIGIGLGTRIGWASGWLPGLVAAGLIVLIRFPRFAIGGGLLALPIGLALLNRIWGALMVNEQYSWMTRLKAWGIISDILSNNPILGVGPANYYYYTPQFSILGWYVKFNSHNNYFDIAAQVGLAGLLTFFWFALEIGRDGVRVLRTDRSGFAGAYAAGALGGLAGSLVAGLLGDWILPFVYNIGLEGFRSSALFWVFLGGLFALRRMVREPAGSPLRASKPLVVGQRLETALREI